MDTNEIKKLAGPAYLIGALMVGVTVMDLLSNMVPIRVGDPSWRYGVIGLGSGFLMTPMLGMVVIVFVAAIAGQRGVGRVVGWVNLVFAILIVPLIGFFLLDALQIRGLVQPESLREFDIGIWKAVVKLLAGLAAFGWLGWTGIKLKDRARRPDETPGFIRPPSTPATR